MDSVDRCNFSAGTLRTSFISQTRNNGTGSSINFGLVKPARATALGRYCLRRFPPDANLDNTFVQVSSVTGSCLSTLVPGTSVATADGSCNAQELLVDNLTNAIYGSRRSADTCPACRLPNPPGIDGHIDNFTSSQSCSAHAVGDLGNFWTLQTP